MHPIRQAAATNSTPISLPFCQTIRQGVSLRTSFVKASPSLLPSFSAFCTSSRAPVAEKHAIKGLPCFGQPAHD